MLDRYGAFLESSYVSGTNYRSSYKSYRYADFAIRVPSASFDSMTNGLDALGSVLYCSTNVQNITPQFYDLEARLRTYETEESRLLEMLEKAETVEDMILVEERLSNVRYNIESAQTTLDSWQTQVDYSTVALTVTEVEELIEKTETHQTYGQEISQGFSSTLNSIGRFFKNLFKNVIIALPLLVLIAIIVIVVLVIIIKVRKKRRSEK